MDVRFHNVFKKQYKKAPLEIREAFDKKLEIFRQDKFFPLLNNHALTGKFKGLRSINITGDWRAIFEEVIIGEAEVTVFHKVQTHSELYG